MFCVYCGDLLCGEKQLGGQGYSEGPAPSARFRDPAGVAVSSTGVFYVFKPENLMLIFLFQLVGSLVGGPISALLWVMYADTADYSEWRTGRRATGLVFSASIMSNKIGWAVGSMIAAFILDQTGFVANVAQSESSLGGIRHMMSTIPAGVALLAIVVAYFYGINAKLEKQIAADLLERKRLRANDPTALASS